MTDLNPQAKQMADESMVRNLDAQARAIWPQEVELFRRYALPSEARILDAGCGPGEIASRLADLFPRSHVLGVDIIDHHLNLARSRYSDLASRLSFEHQSVFELNAADRSFDLTVCRHVLHSIPHADRVIAELVRVTRGGGYLHMIPEDYGMLHFVVVDTIRVPRETFATIITAWRDGYAESIAQLTPFTRESAVQYFNQMIENIRDPRGYAVWMVPVVSARVPSSAADGGRG